MYPNQLEKVFTHSCLCVKCSGFAHGAILVPLEVHNRSDVKNTYKNFVIGTAPKMADALISVLASEQGC